MTPTLLKKDILLFALLYFCSYLCISAQNYDFDKDSLDFEAFYKNGRSFSQDYEKTKEFFEVAIRKLDTLQNKYPNKEFILRRRADVFHKLAIPEINSGNFAEALNYLEESIESRKQTKNPDDAAFAYYLKGIVWVRQDRYSKVKTAYDSAYAMTERLIKSGKNRHAFKANLLSAYAGHYANVDSIDKAEFYFKKAISYADSINDKNASATNRIQYAEVLIGEQQNYSEALKLQSKAMDLYRELGYKDDQMNTASEMARSYNGLGNYKKALQLKQEFIDHLRETGRKDRLLLELDNYVIILENNKLFKEALIHQRELTNLRDSLRNEKNYKELADLDAKLKYESKKSLDSLNIISERKLIEAENEKKASVQFWIVVTILLTILGGIAFFYLKNRQKIKEQAYQNILLNNKVATKTEEINELLTETIQHIKSKERIAENLQKLSNENEGITLKSIIADLKASKADNAKLMLIKQNIEQVNFEFIKHLKNRHPELTKTDVEICSLIRIGLSRKEVANLRNTSLEAVKTSRFRIKKKLNLSAEQSLDDYINCL
ncbi:tetratricopeptide repeat protein [Hanstruepera flava]|uniref:tetratricopeptide repeat protein n=1 Tax=Hanstruepera flava TaxID=2930218 RepID=UPI002028BAF5|nr:tetratricopeptide repeat protein [Hanstruepera flava]